MSEQIVSNINKINSQSHSQFVRPVLSEHVQHMMSHFSEKYQTLSTDDVTLADLPSHYHPNQVLPNSWITRKICLNTFGLMSAAMDTVTDKEMALAMAKLGGVGIIHRNMSLEQQIDAVRWVRNKIHFQGMIEKPILFYTCHTVAHVLNTIQDNVYHFSNYPIIDRQTGKLFGMMNKSVLDFVDVHDDHILRQDIVSLQGIDVLKDFTNVLEMDHASTRDAYRIMRDKRLTHLPVVDKEYKLKGLYTWKDLRHLKETQPVAFDQPLTDSDTTLTLKHVTDSKNMKNPQDYSLDDEGKFLVGVAIGVSKQDITRAILLHEKASCKLFVIDSSHGASADCVHMIQVLKSTYRDKIQLIVGNVASFQSAYYLLEQEHIPDGIKVGIGPGSICTTRQVTGHGIPQLSAVYSVYRATCALNVDVPIIADGGIRTSGDIVKLMAVGASGFMMGSMLAGTDESPGNIIEKDGRKFKRIRGMGSRQAMEQSLASRLRYNQLLEEDDNEDDNPINENMCIRQERQQGVHATRNKDNRAFLENNQNVAPDSHVCVMRVAQCNQSNGQPDLLTKSTILVTDSETVTKTTRACSNDMSHTHVSTKRPNAIKRDDQKRKITPEGVEGLVQYKGALADIIQTLKGGICAGLAHSGAKNVTEFQQKSLLYYQSAQGYQEGKPHDIIDPIS